LSAQHDLIRRCYAAFNARDIDAALEDVRPDVDWPNAIDGGRLHGHDEVRAYWTRQFATIAPHVEPQALSDDEQGRTVVDVHQVVRDLDGNVLADQHVQHVYTVSAGLIARMDIEQQPGLQVTEHPPASKENPMRAGHQPPDRMIRAANRRHGSRRRRPP
jgi:hypothetical protein